MSSKKTKYELKDNKATAATFTADEIRNFAALGTDYGHYRRGLYISKMLARDPNPRLEQGMEVLNSTSMVADVDMMPLTTRQNMARFSKYGSDLIGDGFDADDSDDRDITFDSPDRSDNPPTPHELRAKRLEKKLDRALKAKEKAVEKAREAGDTPLPDGDKNPPVIAPAAEKGAKKE